MSVLIAFDGSEASRAALQHAAREAHLRDESLEVLHSLETTRHGASLWGWGGEEDVDRETLRTETRQRIASLVDSTLESHPEPEDMALHVVEGSPASEIEAHLEVETHELVVIGATGRGQLERFLLGSTTERVVRNSSVPVLIVPEDTSPRSYEQILAPTDFSECARLGVEEAARLTARDGAELIVLHEAYVTVSGPGRPEIAPSGETIQDYRLDLQEKLDGLLEAIALDSEQYRTLLHVHPYDRREPADAIIEAARDRDIDLIVMGTHGRRGMERWLLGSTTYEVLHRLPCPVLTLRTTRDEQV